MQLKPNPGTGHFGITRRSPCYAMVQDPLQKRYMTWGHGQLKHDDACFLSGKALVVQAAPKKPLSVAFSEICLPSAANQESLVVP